VGFEKAVNVTATVGPARVALVDVFVTSEDAETALFIMMLNLKPLFQEIMLNKFMSVGLEWQAGL
jgi:hypothetical protein